MMMMQAQQRQACCSAQSSSPRSVCASLQPAVRRRANPSQPHVSNSRRCSTNAASAIALPSSRRQQLLGLRAQAEGAGSSGLPEDIKPEGAPSLLPPGTKVRVAAPVLVFHVPKNPQGVQLQGMEGEVEKCVALYTDKQGKSHVLSPNFPYLVKLSTQIEGKDVNFKAHLVSVGSGGRCVCADVSASVSVIASLCCVGCKKARLL